MIKNLENKMEKMQELINKDLEELKNKHAETNKTIAEIKNTPEGISSRIFEAEEQSVSWKIKVLCTSEEQNKVKRMEITEDNLRDLQDNIKCTNVRIIGLPEEEEKKKGYEKIFEDIIVENFPNMEKEIVNQIQEVQRVPQNIRSRINMLRHILIKLTKITHKGKILKVAREKEQVTYEGNAICLTTDHSAETLQARRE